MTDFDFLVVPGASPTQGNPGAAARGTTPDSAPVYFGTRFGDTLVGRWQADRPAMHAEIGAALVVTLARYVPRTRFELFCRRTGKRLTLDLVPSDPLDGIRGRVADFVGGRPDGPYGVRIVESGEGDSGSDGQDSSRVDGAFWFGEFDDETFDAGASAGRPRLVLTEVPGLARIDFDPRRHADAYVRWFAACVEHVAAQLGQMSGHGRLSDVALHDAGLHRRLLTELGAPTIADHAFAPAHDYVFRHADSGKVAIWHEGRTLSYLQLTQVSNTIAANVRSQVGRDLAAQPSVLVLIEPCLMAPAVMLGIFRAGCRYVPVAADTPTERIRYVIEDCRPSLVVVGGLARQSLPADLPAGVAVVDVDTLSAAREYASNGHAHTRANDIAYVIYTSGSTGRPKGVPITHAALAGHMFGCMRMIATRPMAGASGVLASSLGFDVSVWEMCYVLWQGGTLHVLAPEVCRNPQAMADYLYAQRLETACIRPSILPGLVSEFERSGRELYLRTIFSGAEAISYETCARLRRIAPEIDVVVGYGATETTIGGTLGVFDPTHDYGYLPVGKPLQNYRIYILDDDGRLCPLGATGNIHMGGPMLSLGYLNRDDLTAQAFVPDPFDSAPHARMYRTGDRGRWLPDGNLMFCGRGDDQVKIAGVRVELGEVEVVFRAASGAQNVLALVEREGGRDRLIVYLEGATSDRRTTFDTAARHLPRQMLPAAIVAMEMFPLTSSMKVDRQQLPKPQRTDLVGSHAQFAAPTREIERDIVTIACRLLGMEQIGIDDNLDELGFSSLMLVAFLDGVNSTVPRKLTPQDLIALRTIRAIGEWATDDEPVGSQARSKSV